MAGTNSIRARPLVRAPSAKTAIGNCALACNSDTSALPPLHGACAGFSPVNAARRRAPKSPTCMKPCPSGNDGTAKSAANLAYRYNTSITEVELNKIASPERTVRPNFLMAFSVAAVPFLLSSPSLRRRVSGMASWILQKPRILSAKNTRGRNRTRRTRARAGFTTTAFSRASPNNTRIATSRSRISLNGARMKPKIALGTARGRCL
mmetsp:Transcript_9749/g.19138  ORF Transcript_9749/g.19138 Transcript_9749/m.19138 type:complete len:207 (+) Transcript_9749:600-1220(+)